MINGSRDVTFLERTSGQLLEVAESKHMYMVNRTKETRRLQNNVSIHSVAKCSLWPYFISLSLTLRNYICQTGYFL